MDHDLFQLHSALEHSHWWFTGRREIIYCLIRCLAPPGRNTTLVEIGCGTGGNLVHGSRDYATIGMDASPVAVAAARRALPASAVVCSSSVSDLPPRRSGDTRFWLLLDVLEHVADDRGLLSEVSRAMAVGEHVLVTVPADPSLWDHHDEVFGHFRRYTLTSLRRVWDNLPFAEELLSHFNARLYFPVRLARGLFRLLRRSGGCAGTDFFLPPEPINRLLHRIFAGECRRLARVFHGARGYRHGVSAVAVLTRIDGAFFPNP